MNGSPTRALGTGASECVYFIALLPNQGEHSSRDPSPADR